MAINFIPSFELPSISVSLLLNKNNSMDFTAFRDMRPFSQLMFAIFLMVASVFVFMILGIIFALPFVDLNSLLNSVSSEKMNSPEGISFLKYFQIVQSVGLFCVPPFVVAWLYDGQILKYLNLHRSTKARSYLLASLALLSIIPFINFLGDLNSKLSLPASLAGIENWMKSMEEGAKILTEKFMAVDSFGGFLFNVFMIAIIPALGEELMFRGVFQRIFTNWTKNHHWGIWITAFLFSAIHMQFYGFLPRLLLGAMFGYLLVWTGSIWVPIVAHFVNNFVGVTGYFLMGNGTISNDVEEWGTGSGQLPVMLASFLIVCTLLYLIYRGERAKTKMPANQVDSQA